MTDRIGIFGGTFDPIHVGHLAAAHDATWRLSLDRVLFVPNNIPPHKQDQRLSEPADRVAMVQAATADNPLFAVSRLEVERSGPSYTLDTMRQLSREFGASVQLVFLAGLDALLDLHTWREPEALLAEFGLVFLRRPGGRPFDWGPIEDRFPRIRDRVKVVPIPQLEISGSDIRERVRTGRPIRYYVTPPVEEYIVQRRLYRVSC
ncbi:MAG: nicotinate-nucleotide adenylyltransferase [Chloroflexota bacterium]